MAAATAASASMSLDDDAPQPVILVSKSGKEVSVSEKAARLSELVVKTLEGSEERKIPLPAIDDALLDRVVPYLEHHATNPPRRLEPPVRTSNFAELVTEFDKNFMDVEPDIIWDLVLAANFMSIKSLLDLCCAKLATLIRGKNTEELRKLFNIANDFTPEEEAQLIEENKWAFE